MMKLCLASVAALGLSYAALAPAGSAAAASCPKDKVGVDFRPMSSEPAAGVTDEVQAAIDLSKEPARIEGRMLRLRKLVIQPGGVVPWHSHGDRPAIILVTKGVIVEYASTCSVPIAHGPGDATTEMHPTAHWWRNEGKEPVELYSADLFPSEMMHGAEAHQM